MVNAETDVNLVHYQYTTGKTKAVQLKIRLKIRLIIRGDFIYNGVLPAYLLDKYLCHVADYTTKQPRCMVLGKDKSNAE